MKPTFRQYALEVISGKQTGAQAALLRGALSCAEPIYSIVTHARNRLYNRNWLMRHSLDRPAISVGNITTGGTGKTPLVQWLAESLRRAGRRPAILMRGYRVGDSNMSDEQMMLDKALNREGLPTIPVCVNPDRVAGARAALSRCPQTDVFVLDDAFQHRRVRRDLDIVLINALDPFGYDHVLPRGLLREPLAGLARAGAIVVTRSNLADSVALHEIERRIHDHNDSAPIFRAEHVLTGFRTWNQQASEAPDHPLKALSGRPFYAFAGIADPEGFRRQLELLDGKYVGHHWFADHHAYKPNDLEELQRSAGNAGAELILTTDKDWVKIADLPGVREGRLPVWRCALEIRFGAEPDRLLDLVLSRLPAMR